MSVLLIITPGAPSAGVEETPLSRSLATQTSIDWVVASSEDEQHPSHDLAMHLSWDDELEPDAVATITETAQDWPNASAIYSDIESGGRRVARPAWSPTRALTDPASFQGMAFRSAALTAETRRSHSQKLEELRVGGAEVIHIPQVLVALKSAPRQPARSIAPWPDHPPVSIIIPSAGFEGRRDSDPRRLIDDCLASLRSAAPVIHEILVVIGDEFAGAHPEGPDLRVVDRGPGTFDFSEAVNAGLLAASGELVLILNDDIEATTTDWISLMAAHLKDETVGCVGAALFYPDDTIQHIGMVIDDARPLHPFVGHTLGSTTDFGGDVARDVVAVTGACLMARRRDLLAIGGFSKQFPLSFNDVDLCLRLHRGGLRVVVEPAARLIHQESASREARIEKWEWDRFVYRWGHVQDPWYHPAYHRPDDPNHLNRNADHLDPVSADSWAARDSGIHPRVHRARSG